jgi:hypothetical protein
VLHTISFDPASDALTAVLESVAAIYGTTLTELNITPASPLKADHTALDKGNGRAPTFAGPWNEKRALKYLEVVADKAYEMIALVTAHGTVTRQQAMDYLKVSALRGHLSSLGTAPAHVPGLPKDATPWKKVLRDQPVYVMSIAVREIFTGAFAKFDPEALKQAAKHRI